MSASLVWGFQVLSFRILSSQVLGFLVLRFLVLGLLVLGLLVLSLLVLSLLVLGLLVLDLLILGLLIFGLVPSSYRETSLNARGRESSCEGGPRQSLGAVQSSKHQSASQSCVATESDLTNLLVVAVRQRSDGRSARSGLIVLRVAVRLRIW